MEKIQDTAYFTLKGGLLLHPESIMVKDDLLLYFRGTIFSPLKYSVSIPLDQIQSIQSNHNQKNITIKSRHISLTCRRFSAKKLRKLMDLIETAT
jgi:hypothetical protein